MLITGELKEPDSAAVLRAPAVYALRCSVCVCVCARSAYRMLSILNAALLISKLALQPSYSLSLT